MAKVYLEPSDSVFRVNDNNVTIYGANENQIIILATGVTGVTVDQNVEEVVFEKTSADYTYEQNGNQVKVFLGGVLQAIIPVQGDADGTKLTFANGAANATLKDGVMTLGGSKSEGSSSGSLNPATVLSNTPTTPPTDTGGNDFPTPPTPAFTVINTAGVVTFGGTATGDITFTISGTVATFSRGGATATTTVDFSSGFSKITVASGQTLSVTAAQITGKSIDGVGSVAVTALESTLSADLSGIATTAVTAAVTTVSGTSATFTGSFGKAVVTTSGDGILNVDSGGMGTATFSVAWGTTLQGSAAKLGGVSATGTGSVEVTALGASTNLSPLNSTLNVTATVSSSVDISSNSNLTTVDAYSVASGQTLTMTASQADAKSITGAGSVTITGVAGNETLNIAATGTNSITAGVGADNVTLGGGADTLIYAGEAVPSVTETHALTFQALTAGQSVTVDGLTLSATGAITAANAAAGFASLAVGAATGNAVTNGVWSGALSSGWSSGAASAAAVTFTSATVSSNVTDISTSVAGVSAPAALSDSATQGVAEVTGVTEIHAIAFKALTTGQTVTVGGLTLTATGNIAEADVNTSFENLADGASTGNTVANGTWNGVLTAGWTTGSFSTGFGYIWFVSVTPNSNVTDLTYSTTGDSLDVSVGQGVAPVAAVTETHALTFVALTAGQSVTVDGLTLTATGAITANAVAAGFASLSVSASVGNAVTNGVWSGALSSGWSSGAASSAAVTFTSVTTGADVADIITSVAGVSAPTAVSLSSTQGVTGTSSSDSPSTGFDVVTGFCASDIIDWSSGAIARASAATAASGTAGLVGNGAKATFDAADTTFANHLAAIENAIRATSNTAGEAAHWQEGADAYVFISDGSNGVGDGDILIKLVGVDLTNAANDVITIVANNLTLA